MRRTTLLFASLLLAAAGWTACQSETSLLSSREVVSQMPWTPPEEARYRLLDGDEVRGEGVLRIEARDGELVFRQEFESEEFEDRVTAVTEASTMLPLSVERTIEGPEGDRRWQVEYRQGVAVVVQGSQDDERTDEVSVPTRAYDSWTDVFLWRTIEFAEGFEATYADVLTATLARPRVISQSLRVVGLETVEVPAGTFEAWRLEIRTADGEQTAWYADTGTRPLVRYDNGELVFELVSLEEGPD